MSGEGTDILTISGLHAGYGAGDILKGIEATVRRGRVVAIIGPNGSGKSTLIKTLVGLLAVRQGQIVLDGESMNALNAPARVRAGMSYVPQEYNVFRNLTVLENLKIAREFMTVRTATRSSNPLDDELLALFPELPAKFGMLAGNLSGGQRQMLAFACALTVHPKILLLDEPSAGLSPKYIADIFATVRKVNPGKSIRLLWQDPGLTMPTPVEIKFAPAGARTTVMVTIDRLQTRAEADGYRRAWGEALDRLKGILE